MNTHETYVHLETAKLLKRAGFDWEVNHWYSRSTRLMDDSLSTPLNWNESGVDEEYSAPTLPIAQKWLREVKHLTILVEPPFENTEYDGQAIVSVLQPFIYDNIKNEYLDCVEITFNTYEEALEAGINKCLTLLLKEE